MKTPLYEITGPLSLRSSWSRRVPHRTLPNGDLEIDLRRGEEVLIHAAGHRPDTRISPVTPTEPAPPWGLP